MTKFQKRSKCYALLQTLAALLGVVVQWTTPLSQQPYVLSLSQWEPQVGDVFIVDTKANMGYLMHPDGGYMVDVVGSGQREVVGYGKFGSYDATTPEDVWRVKSTTIQKDVNIFGPTGLFLRMYGENGEEYTSYGIHDVGNSKELLANEDRYKSMGCILVRADLLKILKKEYDLHKDGDGFLVVTTYGFDGRPPLQLAAR